MSTSIWRNRVFPLHGALPDGWFGFGQILAREDVLVFLVSQPWCLVVIEACASAHYRGQERQARSLGGTHAADLSESLGQASQERRRRSTRRPPARSMRFAFVKTGGQQARGMLFRTRRLYRQSRSFVHAVLPYWGMTHGKFLVVGRAHPARFSRMEERALHRAYVRRPGMDAFRRRFAEEPHHAIAFPVCPAVADSRPGLSGPRLRVP